MLLYTSWFFSSTILLVSIKKIPLFHRFYYLRPDKLVISSQEERITVRGI